MDAKDIYKLKDKTSEQVKLAYIAFMGDKDATTKQIKDAENSNYAKIGTKQIVSEIVQKLIYDYGLRLSFLNSRQHNKLRYITLS